MKKKIKKNINQRYLFKQYEKQRLILKIISKNLNLKKEIRFKLKERWINFENITSLTRIKNICILTGRSRSIYRFLKLSRIQFRKLASIGFLPGISKYSW